MEGAVTRKLTHLGALVLQCFNNDQGSQFTGQTFTDVLVGHGISISMDGKGPWRYNVFVERLWRTAT
jgi:transposase InsO family protein